VKIFTGILEKKLQIYLHEINLDLDEKEKLEMQFGC
jgi:hypothetical protein